jgi:hypothetical protein
MIAGTGSNVIISMQRPIITTTLESSTVGSILELETANAYRMRQQIEQGTVVHSQLI